MAEDIIVTVTEGEEVVNINIEETVPEVIVVTVENHQFELIQDLSPQLGGDLDTNGYLFISSTIPSANNSAVGKADLFIVGESVTFGDLLYMKADGKMWKANATSDATMPAVVMALESKSMNQECRCLSSGVVRRDVWALTPGQLVFPGKTDGSFVHNVDAYTTGNMAQAVGYTLPQNCIMFNPSYAMVKIK